MGMLATMINALALMDALEKNGVEVRVQTAIPMDKIAEPFIQRRAIRHFEKGRVVVFGARTGNPYCTTDYAAALRANEINADIIMKATKVDGIYDKDPMKHTDAVKYEHLTYDVALQKRLGVMDAEAFALCQTNKMPILVFDMNAPNSIRRAITGETIGTLVDSTPPPAISAKKDILQTFVKPVKKGLNHTIAGRKAKKLLPAG